MNEIERVNESFKVTNTNCFTRGAKKLDKATREKAGVRQTVESR